MVTTACTWLTTMKNQQNPTVTDAQGHSKERPVLHSEQSIVGAASTAHREQGPRIFHRGSSLQCPQRMQLCFKSQHISTELPSPTILTSTRGVLYIRALEERASLE